MLRTFFACLCLCFAVLGLSATRTPSPSPVARATTKPPQSAYSTETPSLFPALPPLPFPTSPTLPPAPDGQSSINAGYEAVKQILEARQQTDAVTQFNTGLSYYLGQGAPKNYAKAVEWFRKAAEQDFAPAQGFLGSCYLNGQGVKKDFAQAVKWLRKAAEQGDIIAQSALGFAYCSAGGVAKDPIEGVKWLRKAAEQDNADAQANLGLCYAQGEGVPKDEVQAYKWWLLGAAKGNATAKKGVAIAENRMTRYEIALGQKLARDFKGREVPSEGAESPRTAPAQTHLTASGTGFFITEDGYLITNEHVARSGARVRLATSSGLIDAKVVKADAANDLALIKAEGKFEALPVATSRAVKLGSTVATVGFPNVGMQGFSPKFARGEIASLTGPRDDPRFFQISVPLQPGNSGGALVDERGNVVGVVSAKLSAAAALKVTGELPENVNYAVRSSLLLGFLESMPEVAAKLKEPNTSDMQPADVVEKAKEAAVLVLVY